MNSKYILIVWLHVLTVILFSCKQDDEISEITRDISFVVHREDFDFDTTNYRAPISLEFEGKYVGEGVKYISYTWKINDSIVSGPLVNISDHKMRFLKSGEYKVTLIVALPDDTLEETKTITIQPETYKVKIDKLVLTKLKFEENTTISLGTFLVGAKDDKRDTLFSKNSYELTKDQIPFTFHIDGIYDLNNYDYYTIQLDDSPTDFEQIGFAYLSKKSLTGDDAGERHPKMVLFYNNDIEMKVYLSWIE